MTQGSQERGTLSHEDKRAGVKKTYVLPSLIEYGSVAKLTQTGSGSGGDGGTGAMRMVCL